MRRRAPFFQAVLTVFTSTGGGNTICREIRNILLSLQKDDVIQNGNSVAEQMLF